MARTSFARLKQIMLESYDRIVGLVLDQIAIDGMVVAEQVVSEIAW